MNVKVAPHLCKPWDGVTIPADCRIEPKLDGVRGLILHLPGGGRAIRSRNDKPLWNVEHCFDHLLDMGHYVLDGEFYARDHAQSVSIVKTQYAHPDAKMLIFYVFDIIPFDEWVTGRSTLPFSQRREFLLQKVAPSSHCVIVPQLVNIDPPTAFRNFTQEGYEGIVIKDGASLYRVNKRGWGWWKMKPEEEIDLIITNAIEGMGKHVGRLGALAGAHDSSAIVSEVGTGLSDAQREELWKLHLEGKLVGRVMEVRYQNITPDNSLRFPVFHRLKEEI